MKQSRSIRRVAEGCGLKLQRAAMKQNVGVSIIVYPCGSVFIRLIKDQYNYGIEENALDTALRELTDLKRSCPDTAEATARQAIRLITVQCLGGSPSIGGALEADAEGCEENA